MNRSDLINELKNETLLSRKDAEKFVERKSMFKTRGQVEGDVKHGGADCFSTGSLCGRPTYPTIALDPGAN